MKPLVTLLLPLLQFSLGLIAQEPIRYTASFPAPQTHYLEISATVPAGKPQVELFMAVWTPGSYLVREYARNVEGFRAFSPTGAELLWRKTRKNRWQVDAGGASHIEVKYKVYARELSVQGNWVDASFAMLNGAPNFMTLVGEEKRPYEVRLVLPPSWAKSISGMKEGPAPHSFVAADFDELLDCPIYAGNAPIHEFVAAGRKHFLVNEGEGPMWDGPASAAALARIVEEYARMFNGLPYEKYVFFNIIAESGGGLEHKNSTWIGASRWAWSNAQEPSPDAAPGQRRASRLSWLGLASHEYFHLWNVKRLRPVELGPFDYENEVYSRSLWIAEGFTSYYGPLTLGRAQACEPDRHAEQSQRHDRLGSNDTGTPGATSGDLVLRFVDQAIPAQRELFQHLAQLLPQGCGDRVSARCQNPRRDERRKEPRRPHAPCAGAIRQRTRLHA